MIKVEIWEAYGQGAMGRNYWNYRATVFHKGSVKKALRAASRKLYESAKDKDGFNWIPVMLEVKIYKNNKLISWTY